MLRLITLLCLGISTVAFGQASPAPAKPGAPAQPPAKVTLAQVMDRQLTSLEGEFVPAAEAMPENKFNFVPTQGEFKGVRTFALQVKHVAQTNYVTFSALLGEKLPATVDPKEDNGSEKLTSKAEIIKFLKDSFALGHRTTRGARKNCVSVGRITATRFPCRRHTSQRSGHPLRRTGRSVRWPARCRA